MLILISGFYLTDRTSRQRRVALTIASVFLGLLLAGPTASTGEPPKRLRLKIEKRTLKVGEKTRVIIEFLDRNFEEVPNDKKRTVELKLARASKGQMGTGEISPPRVEVESGKRSAETTFKAKVPGKLIIRATSKGLAPAQTLVIIAGQQASSLYRFIRPAAQAQPNITVKIEPEDIQPVPANNLSRATLWVTLDRVLKTGEQLVIRVRTIPGSTVLYQGRERVGFTDIEVGEGNLSSEDIYIRSSRPGTVRVSAEVISHAAKDQVEVVFEPPRPVKIFFENEQQTIPSHQSEVPLAIKLADQDGVPIARPDREFQIELSSPTDPDIVDFESGTLNLSPEKPFAQTRLLLQGLPTGAYILLLALSPDGDVTPGEKTITLESPVKKVVVSGPRDVIRGGREYDFTVHLADKNGHHLMADWDRKFGVSVDGGEVSPEEITILKGEEHTSFTYRSPSSVGIASFSVESRGLEPGSWQVDVVTRAYVLVLLAGLGGIVGGFARRVYKKQVTRVWPGWVGGHLELGLVGNALFGFVFGLVLFQAAKLGVIQISDLLAASQGVYAETRTFAFFFGVLGGFGGTVVLERLLGRILPERKN